MARSIRGRRDSGNPFDDRVSFSMKSLNEVSAMTETKVMRGRANLGPFNPFTARDADKDFIVGEGRMDVNFGRGVPDPTPFGIEELQGSASPMNRAERRIRKAKRPRPTRKSNLRPDLRGFMLLSGGAMGEMSEAMERYPRPESSSLVERWEVEQFVQSTESKVDDALGARPETMKQLLSNLRRLVDITNGIGSDGQPTSSGTDRNFSMMPVFFISQTQDSLTKALGGRFNGPETVPSPQDLGIYYMISSEILDNPEAFRNVSLFVMPSNMPDVPPPPGPSGSHGLLPVYYEMNRDQPRSDRRVSSYGVPQGVLPSSVVSSAGVRDYTDSSMVLAPKTTNAKITSVVTFPIYAHGAAQVARFRGLDVASRTQTITFESKMPEMQIESYRKIIESYEKALASMGEVKYPYPLIDTTILSVATSMLDEARALRKRADDALAENPNASARQIDAINEEAQSLIRMAEQAVAMGIALHEMGHHMDSVGEYKSSSAYGTATSTTTSGLNSSYEYKRDMAALEVLAKGEDSPYLDDFSETLARDWMRSSLKEILSDYSMITSMADAMEALSDLGEKLSGVDEVLERVSRPSSGAANWLQLIIDGRTKTLRDALDFPLRSGVIKPIERMSPEEAEAVAQQAIDMIRDATPAYSVADAFQVVERVPRLLRFAMDDKSLENLLREASPQSRAYVKIAAARAYRDMMANAIANASKQLSSMADEAREKLSQNKTLIPWLNEQSIDMDGHRNGWSTLISDILAANPNAVDEFMNISARIERRDGWLDADGNFNRKNYVRDVLRRSKGDGKTWSTDSILALTAINRAINKRGYSGWKELSDEEAEIAAGAASAISDYAGQADYTLSSPIPKFQQTSNAETYAELHVAIVSQMENLLSKLTQEEYDVMRKLHDQMMAEVNRLRSNMNTLPGDERGGGR